MLLLRERNGLSLFDSDNGLREDGPFSGLEIGLRLPDPRLGLILSLLLT